ncbi:MAG TPA: IniB N-terminal domain-containing protein, partial [Mycobacterium sp.]|nr:IniB N-terminal domain-containing protein [Mycobacterium sp.]
MIALIDWILSLFRDEDAARAFVTAPEQAMRDAGLAGISAAQLSSVAATAVPGLVLGGGNPIVGLQRVVANQYGFTPVFPPQPSFDPVWAPAPTYAPQAAFAPGATYAPENTFAPQTTSAPQTTTDLASHNDTALF